MIRTIAAGMALALSMGTAHATAISLSLSNPSQYYYETDSTTSEASGTVASGGTNSDGGLCTPGSSGCPSIGLGAGSLTSGSIVLTTPNVAGSLLLQISIAPNPQSTLDGDIYDVTLNGTNLGTTSIVALSGPSAAQSSGTFSVLVHGNTSYTVGITDLLEQYVDTNNNEIDDLPGTLNSLDTGLDGGTVTSAYDSSKFVFTASLSTYAPEPASITLFASGIVALGAWRRRRSH
jgi:hypothetical protein